MICLADLSPLMQRAIAKEITLEVNRVGNFYNLCFSKHMGGRRSKKVKLMFYQKKGVIYWYTDGKRPTIAIETVEETLDFVESEIYGGDNTGKTVVLNSSRVLGEDSRW